MRRFVLVLLASCAEGLLETIPDPPQAGGAIDASTAVDVVTADSASDAGVEAAADVVLGFCGDGFIDPGEVCDDGNDAGIGCSSDCKNVECTFARHYEDTTTHHCYWRETNVGKRASAIAACSAAGGHLVRWSSAAERDAIYPSVLGAPKGRVWLGITRSGSVWTWDDGTAAADLNWRSGEPSGDGDCAEWGPENAMNDIPCSVERDFICERPPPGKKR